MNNIGISEDGITNGFIQLGIAGAALLIVLIFVVLLFKLFANINARESGNQNIRIDKLCEKIDSLITSFSENTQKLNQVLLISDIEQKNMINMITRVLEIEQDIQKSVERIEVRTIQIKENSEGD